MMRGHRKHALWFAHLLHRISGLALAVFLPLHFYVLGLALTSPAHLDDALRWADAPLVKVAEFGLVFLLSAHFFGGLRLLALELLPWSGPMKTAAAISVAGSFFIAGVFLLNAV